MRTMTGPRYVHDCDACTFKGQAGPFDVYFCAQSDGGTWIARDGDDGPAYASWPECVIQAHEVRQRYGGEVSAAFSAMQTIRRAER